jgi:hypothetical protein
MREFRGNESILHPNYSKVTKPACVTLHTPIYPKNPVYCTIKTFKEILAGHWKLRSVILATWEAEVGRIQVQGQLKTSSPKIPRAQ